MFKRIKEAILAVVAAFFVAVSGALPALADTNPWGASDPVPNVFTSGTSYIGGAGDTVVTPFVANLLATLHWLGMVGGALGITFGFLWMHNHISPNAKIRGIEIITTSIVAMVGLWFAPQIFHYLTNL